MKSGYTPGSMGSPETQADPTPHQSQQASVTDRPLPASPCRRGNRGPDEEGWLAACPDLWSQGWLAASLPCSLPALLRNGSGTRPVGTDAGIAHKMLAQATLHGTSLQQSKVTAFEVLCTLRPTELGWPSEAGARWSGQVSGVGRMVPAGQGYPLVWEAEQG